MLYIPQARASKHHTKEEEDDEHMASVIVSLCFKKTHLWHVRIQVQRHNKTQSRFSCVF